MTGGASAKTIRSSVQRPARGRRTSPCVSEHVRVRRERHARHAAHRRLVAVANQERRAADEHGPAAKERLRLLVVLDVECGFRQTREGRLNNPVRRRREYRRDVAVRIDGKALRVDPQPAAIALRAGPGRRETRGKRQRRQHDAADAVERRHVANHAVGVGDDGDDADGGVPREIGQRHRDVGQVRAGVSGPTGQAAA